MRCRLSPMCLVAAEHAVAPPSKPGGKPCLRRLRFRPGSADAHCLVETGEEVDVVFANDGPRREATGTVVREALLGGLLRLADIDVWLSCLSRGTVGSIAGFSGQLDDVHAELGHLGSPRWMTIGDSLSTVWPLRRDARSPAYTRRPMLSSLRDS